MSDMGTKLDHEFVKVGFNYGRRMALLPLFQELGPKGEQQAMIIGDAFFGEFTHPAALMPAGIYKRERNKAVLKCIQEQLSLDEAAAERRYQELKRRYLYMLPPERQPEDVYDTWHLVLRKEKYCEIEAPSWCLPDLAHTRNVDGAKEFVEALRHLDFALDSDDDDLRESSYSMPSQLGPELRKLYECWLKSNNISEQQQTLIDIAADFFDLIYNDSSGLCPTFANLTSQLDDGFGSDFWNHVLEEIVFEDLRVFAQWMHGIAQLYCFLRSCEYIDDAVLERSVLKLKQAEAPYIDFLRERFSCGVDYPSKALIHGDKNILVQDRNVTFLSPD